MKKIFYIILPLFIVPFFIACNPIEDRDGMGDVITSIDQINATATQLVINNIKTNKAKVEFSGKANCRWSNGANIYTRTLDTVLLLGKGVQNIKLTVRSADGTQFVKLFPITVDSLYFPVAPQYVYFCGSGSRTWVWAVDNNYTGSHRIWGNGSNSSDVYPAWWGRTATDAADDNIDINGTMEFKLDDGLMFSKTEFGVTSTGTFNFNMNKHTTTMGIGQVSFGGGTTILHGISQNDAKAVVNTFDIIKLTNDEMILSYPTQSNNYESWFWVFKRKGYNY